MSNQGAVNVAVGGASMIPLQPLAAAKAKEPEMVVAPKNADGVSHFERMLWGCN